MIALEHVGNMIVEHTTPRYLSALKVLPLEPRVDRASSTTLGAKESSSAPEPHEVNLDLMAITNYCKIDPTISRNEGVLETVQHQHINFRDTNKFPV